MKFIRKIVALARLHYLLQQENSPSPHPGEVSDPNANGLLNFAME